MIRLSSIYPVLNSHEVVRRQLLHFEKIGLNDLDDVELILVDDGSDPPIEAPNCPLKRLRILQTHDTRAWTWALARNLGARHAEGTHLLFADIKFIIPRNVIDECRTFDGDRMSLLREFGVLDEHGDFTQDWDVLMAYGLPRERLESRGTKLIMHPNEFCLRKTIFWELGGYQEDRIGWPYPAGEDRNFKAKWEAYAAAGKGKKHPHKPTIYMFPCGRHCGHVDYNPFGLFHTLSRDNDFNPFAKGHRAAPQNNSESSTD